MKPANADQADAAGESPGCRILYLDQNAWIELAKGAWDAATYPAQHGALSRVIAALQAERLVVPLSFANIYETSKINDSVIR